MTMHFRLLAHFTLLGIGSLVESHKYWLVIGFLMLLSASTVPDTAKDPDGYIKHCWRS